MSRKGHCQHSKRHKQYSIPFQVVPYEASTLLSCEQVTKHGLVIIPEQKQTPKNAVIYGSSVDIKYINFLQCNKSKQTNWHTGGESVKQPLTSLDEIKVQYKDIFEGLAPSQASHTTSTSIQVYHQNVSMPACTHAPAR